MRRLTTIAAWLLLLDPAIAQEPSLDDLERRLETQRASEAQKQAEARRRSEAARIDAQRSAQLVLETDASCNLRIDGQGKGTLRVGEPLSVTVLSGDQLLECTSTEFPDAKFREVIAVQAGTKAVRSLPVQALLGPARELRAAAASREAAALRFGAVDGWVKDSTTGLRWAPAASRTTLDWNAATAECAGKGSGWRLPSVSEFETIFDRTGTFKEPCGSVSCAVAPSFQLDGCCHWTQEASGEYATYFDLARGTTGQFSTNYAAGLRAVCVAAP